jgi:hypothetical protein
VQISPALPHARCSTTPAALVNRARFDHSYCHDADSGDSHAHHQRFCFVLVTTLTGLHVIRGRCSRDAQPPRTGSPWHGVGALRRRVFCPRAEPADVSPAAAPRVLRDARVFWMHGWSQHVRCPPLVRAHIDGVRGRVHSNVCIQTKMNSFVSLDTGHTRAAHRTNHTTVAPTVH